MPTDWLIPQYKPEDTIMIPWLNGQWLAVPVSRIKRIEYHPDGVSLKSVEFVTDTAEVQTVEILTGTSAGHWNFWIVSLPDDEGDHDE